MKVVDCVKKLRGFEITFKNVYGNKIDLLDMYASGEVEDLGAVKVKDIYVCLVTNEATITVIF